MKYTIIVVNYNKEGTIRRCLESIINQTYKDYSIIVVDDGSTDNSRKILNTYRKYNNIKIYFKNNKGVADARNYAIKRVTTEYFTFVDSDDYIDEKLLEECDKYANYDVLAFSNYEITEEGKIERSNTRGIFYKDNGIDALAELFEKGHLLLVPWGYIYRTELFIKNNLKYPIGYVHEDINVTTLAILNAKNVQAFDYYGYYYVKTKKSITRGNTSEQIDHRIDSMVYHYNFLMNYFKEKIKDEKKLRLFSHLYTVELLYFGSTLKRKKRKQLYKKIEILKIYQYFPTNKFISKIILSLTKQSFIFTRVIIKIYPILRKLFNKEKK